MKRLRNFLALATSLAALALATPAGAAGDPTLKWETVETQHFRVDYYSGERDIAERLADLAESIYTRLVPAVGWPPSEKVELAVTDQTDSANAFTSALPYDAIRFFATAPDDLSPLGDVDDWYVELVTHEFTHVLHTDHIRGIPAIVNAVLGKTLAPNQVQPRWILEGLAVFEESSKTSGGRLRSSIWNMFMRADVLENNVATLDVFSGNVRRWPQGNLWYLYGSFFMQWIAETYGEQAIRDMIDDYAYQLIPYGINRSIRRATGVTYEQMYPAWVNTMKREYAAQAAAIRARGLREGTRITFGGQGASSPRFIPKTAWPGAAGDLVYHRDDGHSTAGMYRVPLRRLSSGYVVAAGRDADVELLARTLGGGTASFLPDGGVVFDSVETHNNLYGFNDLFYLPRGKKSPSGMEGARVRLTDGFRASHPDVSPDGRHVVFVSNHRGTSYLQMADLDEAAGTLSHVHALVHSDPFDQVYSPRFSPDGRTVAYSVWLKGGYRDVQLVDVATGAVTAVTHDRALDGGPSFSPDGKTLFFHSDRTGVMNVYAYDVASRALAQVTNVVNGAMQPQVSPDGRTLAYLGYTHAGYDIFLMPLDPARYLPALPYVDDRPPAPPEPMHQAYAPRPYDPLQTLVPRHYMLNTQPGDFGQLFSVTVSGNDIAGQHAIGLTLSTETDMPDPQANLTYTYGRLPVDLSLSAYRSIAPGSTYSVGPGKQTWVQDALGVQSSLGYSIPGAFATQNFSVAYSMNSVGGNTNLGQSAALDPYDTPHVPERLLAGIFSFGWSYSNAQRYLWSVSPERGFSLSASLDLTHPVLGSDYRGFRAHTDLEVYYPMPWLRHHVVALHAGGGLSGGFFPGGPFYVGGYVDVSPLDQLRSAVQNGSFLTQGGIVLRGYPVAVETGAYYALFNAEYRFPILNIDRGPSTLPVMLNRITGNLFVDYGSAFNQPETAMFKTGVGAELWVDLTIGYFLSLYLRGGYARGLASEGIDKAYVVAAVPY